MIASAIAAAKFRAWSRARWRNSPNRRKRRPALTDPPAPCAIADTLAVFDHWLLLPDPTPIYAVLGTVAANLLPGDPVWLGLIAPPSSAKTEILNSISGLPNVMQAATLTVAGLLSGVPKKQRAGRRQGRPTAPNRRLRNHLAQGLRQHPFDAHRNKG